MVWTSRCAEIRVEAIKRVPGSCREPNGSVQEEPVGISTESWRAQETDFPSRMRRLWMRQG